MMDKNDDTVKTYRENFDKYVERTPREIRGDFKRWIDTFLSELPEGGRILEIGSAFGRDARYFREKGFDVLCTDVIPEALDQLSSEGFETAEYDFRNELPGGWAEKFDGFFANAVLLHATREVFEKMLSDILIILKPGGVAAFSVKLGVGEEMSMEKMGAPRYFKYYSREDMQAFLSKYPFEIHMLETGGENKWLHAIIKKNV